MNMDTDERVFGALVLLAFVVGMIILACVIVNIVGERPPGHIYCLSGGAVLDYTVTTHYLVHNDALYYDGKVCNGDYIISYTRISELE